MASIDTAEKINRINGHARMLSCPELLVLESDPTPSHLDYLDLLPSKVSSDKLLPDAVAEFQGRPVLYLADGFNCTDGSDLTTQQIRGLQRLLANRGEHACLGIVKPGSLDVYPINLDKKALARANFLTVPLAGSEAPAFFQSLATGTLELHGNPTQADYVYETIHGLLSEASRELAGTAGHEGAMRGLDVLSTTGRALFFRFLIDRRIILQTELMEICPGAGDLNDCFSNANNAALTSIWLDETFNGDLLPLGTHLATDTSATARLHSYQAYFRDAGIQTRQRLFLHLEAILKGWKHVGKSSFQTKFDIDWDDFNFAHIPIGVLSQVYESFSHQWDEDYAEKTSVYYTPRQIAKILVDEAFAGIENPADAVVLDPACGAGVFLVLAFRQLVREFWKKHGKRPDTKNIQRILYKQLRGFEVSESALRLSALALYISAIEVNGTQRPPRSLKFPRPLRDEVLFDFGEHAKGQKRRFVLGSLGPAVPKSFDGAFDVVITNPPWTRLRAVTKDDERSRTLEKKRIAELNTAFTSLTCRALRKQGLGDLASDYANPDNNPDLPFLWRATEWAKPSGIIAMALPGRIILKQTGNGKVARDAILRGLAVTGILNGSDLEQTPVWPNMKLPFMLLFARNSIPGQGHHFRFVTPVRENRLSRVGRFRIDYKSAESVSVNDVVNKPWLLKTLAVGTVLDVEVIERLGRGSVGEFWEKKDLYSGQGYNLSPNLTQQPAKHLVGLPDFELPECGFALPNKLILWGERHDRQTAHMPRSVRLYAPPLLIVPKAPRESRDQPKAFLSKDTGIAFSQSSYGFSASGSNVADTIATILYLVVHSSLFQYFCLMRSSSQGAGFRIVLKEDLEAFPFPDPMLLTKPQKRRIEQLADLLQADGDKPWDVLDDFVLNLYGLDEHDATVVRDTVRYCGPYQWVREFAEHPLAPDDLDVFCRYLQDMLQPLFRITGQSVVVSPVPQEKTFGYPAWHFVSVTFAEDNLSDWKALLYRLMEEANRTGASRIIVRVPEGGLLIGILNQRRFWTRSRAWLCSLHIEHHHLDAFPVNTP